MIEREREGKEGRKGGRKGRRGEKEREKERKANQDKILSGLKREWVWECLFLEAT